MNSTSRTSIGMKDTILGIQFLFVAFGATVLVPLLVGIDPSVALFTAGVGTIIFHFITKGKVPVYLGSSFAFIAPMIACGKLYGMPAMFGGIVAVGVVYTLLSTIIKLRGTRFIELLFPSVVVGPVIMLIGLSLAPNGVNMAKTNWAISGSVLMVAIFTVMAGKGIFKLIPIFVGLAFGYILSMFLGVINYAPILNAEWFALPKFITPEFKWEAMLYMIPVAIAPIIEHVGDMYAIGGVVNKNFIKEPGLNRTILGDGIATMFAGFLGGPPNTTYSEVTGAISLTKVTNPAVLRITAVTAIIFSLCGKVSGFLQTIPQAVLGGLMLLLFGMIASVGIKTLVDSRIDMNNTRNQVIISVVLTMGIGGAVFNIGDFSLQGIGLASLVGVILNLILPGRSKAVKKTEKDNIVI